MLLARVVGNVVASTKHPSLVGKTLLLVTQEEPDGSLVGPELVAVDAVGAGVGERVLIVLEGRAAGQVTELTGAPVDAAIVGIVDRVDGREGEFDRPPSD